MITIIVGVPGAGKTLYAVSELRKEYAERTVYHYNIPGVNIDSWKELENPEEWHKLPKGSVIVVDEAHQVFPKRDHRVKEPEHIEAAATLRHSGLDLVLITQHPVDLDIFLRRRCARFIFLKKPLSKGNFANAFMWGEYNENYKDEREQQKADNFQFSYPAEAFGTYKSAELHTGKRYMPKAAKRAVAILAIGACVAVLAGGYFYNKFAVASELAGTGTETGQTAARNSPQQIAGTQSDQFISRYMPRIKSLPHTAPIYDNITEAKTFPRLQCVASVDRCQCYSQQATLEYVDEAICRRIIKDGLFDFTRSDRRQGHG